MKIKQRTVRGLGEYVDSMFSSLPFLSIINFGFVTIILYADIHPWIKIYIPWIELWMFLLSMLIGINYMMYLIYKYVLPSLWAFRGKQLFGFESEVMDELEKQRKEIKELRKEVRESIKEKK